MKRMSVFFLVAVLVCAFASRANAQGTVTWASGYPKAGGSSGTIVGQGTATPDSGWYITGGYVVYWPEGGGIQNKALLTVDMNGNWSFSISVPPGATYNIVVQVNFSDRAMLTTVSPDPATATSAP